MAGVTAPHGVCRLAPVRGGRVDWTEARDLDIRPARRDLTGRQRRIVDFIADFTARHGYAPSMREIAAAVGLQSVSSVSYQLGELAAKGALELPGDARQPRSLRLLQGGEVA